MIGSDGAGNPICVNAETNEIWLLDHEDHFRTRQFVNSSLSCLSESLLAYMGETDANRFRLSISEIDPPAAKNGAFWYCEADALADDPK